MKNTIVVFIALVTSISGFSQKAILKIEESSQEIPVTVDEILSADYGDYYVQYFTEVPATLIADEYQYTYKKPITGVFSKTYEVQLIGDNGVIKVYFDQDGNVILIKATVATNSLPDEVMESLATKYAGWTIIGAAEKIKIDAKSGKVTYGVYITNGDKKKQVYITEKAKILND